MALVGSNGDIAWGRTNYIQMSRYDSKENLGKPNDGKYAYVTNFSILPEREKGGVILSIEPMNFGTDKRLAWNYDPGTRRVPSCRVRL